MRSSKNTGMPGQALVEFALILIVLMMILFVVIESARLYQANLTVQNAARAAGRFAITGEFDPSCLIATPKCDDPRLESIKAVALNALTGLPLDDTAGFSEARYYLIEVFSLDDAGNWVADYAGEPGDPILVRVTYRLGILTPILNSIAESVRVRGQVVYNNEQFHQRNLTSGTSPGSDKAPDLPPVPEFSPPRLQIAKSASASTVNRPDPLTYSVTISNIGNGPATGVVFTDTLPALVQYASGAPAGCTTPTIPGGTIACSLSDLLPGDSTSLTYVVDTVAGGSATNTAVVRSAEVGLVSASTTTLIIDTLSADLQVSKTADVTDGEVVLNQEFNYTVSIANGGPATATNVVVTDTLPSTLSFVSVTPGAGVTCPISPASGGSGLLQCEIASLAVGASTDVVIRVSANTAGYIYNEATVGGDQEDADSSNNLDGIEVLAAGEADLSLVKSVSPDRIGVGETMLYTLQVTNIGPNGATGAVVEENMPEGVGLVSMTTTQGICGEDPAVGIVCSLGEIPQGDTVTIQIVTIASRSGWVTNTATVRANEVDPDPSNNADSVDTFIEPFADLAITKSGSDPAVYQGDPLTYTLTVVHQGGANVPRVLVKDQLSRDVTLETATVIAGTPGTCTLSNGSNYVECKLNLMHEGDTSTIEIVVKPNVSNINATPYGDLTNTAIVTSTYNNGVKGEEYRELYPDDNTATVSTYIGPGEQAITIAPVCGSADDDTTVVVTGSNWTVSGSETVQLSIVSADGLTEIYPFAATVSPGVTWSTSVTVPHTFFEPWGAQPWGEYNIRAFRKGDEVALAPFTFPCRAPDLVVDSLTLVSEPAVAGEPVTYNAVIRNQGQTDAGAFPIGLYFDPVGATSTSTSIDAAYQVRSLTVPGLAVGATVSLDFVVSAGFGTHGDHDVWVLADSAGAPFGAIDEILDSNNTLSTPVTVLARPVATADAYTTIEDTPLTAPAPGVLDNDSDADSSFAINTYDPTSANGGTVTLNGDGGFTYAPAPNFHGPDTFTYEICDLDDLCAVATVTISVTSVNDAPVANDNSYTTDEDTVLNVAALGVLGNDTDADGDTLTVATVDGSDVNVGQPLTLSSGALLTINADGSFSYDPNGQFENLTNGESFSESVTYTAGDGTTGSNVATVTFTVTGINDAPLAVDDAYTTDEDATLTVDATTGVLANDSDVEGGALTAALVSGPANGSLTRDDDGSFTYTPNANFSGTDSFTYTASDGQLTSNVATVTITVSGINDAPVASNDSASTLEDTPITIDVAANDTDVDGNLDPGSASVTSGPSNGTLINNGDGTITYTPGANYSGIDSFTYQICDTGQDNNPATDADDLCDSATVTIDVTAVNDAPVAVDDSGYSTDEDTPLSVPANGVLANDSDVEGDPLTAVLIGGPANGSLTLADDGSFIYAPNLNFNGTDSFTYRANDGSADSNLATVTINVNSINDPPVASADTESTPEDTAVTINVAANDTDVDGNLDPGSASVTSAPSNGTLENNGDGTITYTPDANYFGSDGFTYQICDMGQDGDATTDADDLCDSATVIIDVTAVNDAPVAVDDDYSTDEDTPLSVPADGVLANDSDVEGDSLTAGLVSGPANGSVTLAADGSFVYTPNLNFNGTDSFTYRANDGSADSNPATVTITVNPVNDAPVANDNSYDVGEDATLTVNPPGVLSNDTDPEGDPLTVTQVDPAGNGTVTLDADGSFTYTPDANFNGTDSFTYTARDGQLTSDTATVTITVIPANDAPVAEDDTADVQEDESVSIPVLVNDTDIDGDTLAVASITQPLSGTVTANTNGTITFVATGFDYLAPGETATASFTYIANDGIADSNSATVIITVTGVNDAPTAAPDTYDATEDATLSVSAANGVLSNDSDVDGGTLTVSAFDSTSTNGGAVSVATDGSLVYTPTLNFSGIDSFTYTLSDGQGGTDTGTVTISVGGVNDPPLAGDDSATTDEDVPVEIAVLANDDDPDGDTLSVTQAGPATHGTVVTTTDGVTYTPGTNWSGTDSFNYTACDPSGLCSTATVTVTVNAVNDAPLAADDAASATEDGGGTVINVLANDSDVEGETLTVTGASTPANGTAVANADDTVTYTPAANFCGTDTFTYTVTDGTNNSTATVTVTVSCVNDAPVAVDDTYSTDEDVALSVKAPGVLANDVDVDTGDTLTATLVSGPGNGSLTLNGNGSFTYTPNADFNGTDSFTYTASDGQATSNTATVNIDVTPVNDAPVAADDAASATEDSGGTVIDVLANDSDVDNATLTVTDVSTPANGTAVTAAGDSVTYTPAADFCGTDTFTYTVTDGTSDSTATVTVDVSCVNDAPVAGDDTYSTIEDEVLTVNAPGVLANDSDVDTGDTLTATLVSGTSDGSLTVNGDGSFTYTPNTNFNGTDSFTYRASDGQLPSDTATVTITVDPANDAPVANDNTASVQEDTSVGIPVLDNDTDIDGDTLTVASITQPVSGTVTTNADGTVTFTATGFDYLATGETATVTFTYIANDGSADSNSATVFVTITGANDAPVANGDSYSVSEDNTLAPPSGVLDNDTDAEGDTLTASVVSTTSDGSLTLNGDGSFTYTPNTNFNGTDTFTYRANDGSADSNLATVTITVVPVNDAPVANDDTGSVPEDASVSIPVLANDTDIDGDSLTVTSVTDPLSGTVTTNPDGTISFTATGFDYLATGETATVTFTYVAGDGTADSNSATVSVTVTGANDAPVAGPDSYSTAKNGVLSIAAPGLLGNDSDVDSALLSVATVNGSAGNVGVVIGTPAGGTVRVNADGSLTYTPKSGYTGTDSFTYRATDGTLNSNIAGVTITVNP